MKAMRLALSIVAGVLSLAVASPAVAAPPTIEDQPMTVTREDALAAYERSRPISSRTATTSWFSRPSPPSGGG